MAAIKAVSSGNHSFLSGILLLTGFVLLAIALAAYAVLLQPLLWILVVGAVGIALTLMGVIGLSTELAGLLNGRRGDVALFVAGVIGIVIALGYLSNRYTVRFDLTESGRHSLSEQTVTMLEGLQEPVHIAFFHDPLMDQSVELYQRIADQSQQVSVEFHDPMLNPAQARLAGVQFAGTSVIRSGDRELQLHGSTETDIANGILRVSQSAMQTVCFLSGHGEADPFSKESHDHLEGTHSDHSHGMGAKFVLHERHGMAKARHALETLSYQVKSVALTQGPDVLEGCVVLIVAGPKIALLTHEVAAVGNYLSGGGNALLMLDPFVESGLEPVLRGYGVVLDTNIVIDNASHYWTDISAPAVTQYNRHRITRDLPLTFYPGARSLSPTPERVPGTVVTPIVNSSAASYGETSPDRAEYDEARDQSGPTTLMLIANRRPTEPGELTTLDLGPAGAANAATSQQGPPQPAPSARSRIAVVGDSDFATNSFFHFLGNGNLFLNTVSYLAAQENLIGFEPHTYDLPRLSVTNRQIKSAFVVSVLLVPFLLAVIGTLVWWRQR